MGALGWSVTEVDVMEVWQVARFMGIGGDGATGDPVIRGSRGLSTPTDRQKGGKGSQGGAFVDSTIAERARAGAAGSRAVILKPPTPQEL